MRASSHNVFLYPEAVGKFQIRLILGSGQQWDVTVAWDDSKIQRLKFNKISNLETVKNHNH